MLRFQLATSIAFRVFSLSLHSSWYRSAYNLSHPTPHPDGSKVVGGHTIYFQSHFKVIRYTYFSHTHWCAWYHFHQISRNKSAQTNHLHTVNSIHSLCHYRHCQIPKDNQLKWEREDQQVDSIGPHMDSRQFSLKKKQIKFSTFSKRINIKTFFGKIHREITV